jgi:hypothetical protein
MKIRNLDYCHSLVVAPMIRGAAAIAVEAVAITNGSWSIAVAVVPLPTSDMDHDVGAAVVRRFAKVHGYGAWASIRVFAWGEPEVTVETGNLPLDWLDDLAM